MKFELSDTRILVRGEDGADHKCDILYTHDLLPATSDKGIVISCALCRGTDREVEIADLKNDHNEELDTIRRDVETILELIELDDETGQVVDKNLKTLDDELVALYQKLARGN